MSKFYYNLVFDIERQILYTFYKINNGDGVHQNRIMLMTPTGNYISMPVGVFYF